MRTELREYYPHPFVEDLETLHSFLEALHRVEILCSDLEDVFRTVHPVAANEDAFGGKIRELLILAATEVEGQWRSVLEANNVASEGSYYTTRDYVKLLSPMKLCDYVLSLVRFPEWSTRPFGNWQPSQPTQSLNWYDSYNATKHDAVNEIAAATLSHAIESVAACVAMLAAQHGPDSLKRFDFRSPFLFRELPAWPETEWYVPNPHTYEWQHVDAML